MEYTIEKDIPLPDSQKGRRLTYPFADMNVGDSFEFEGDSKKRVSAVNSARSWALRQKNNWLFVTTLYSKKGTVRIWRIK